MAVIEHGGHTFESYAEMMEVTLLRRPDEAWSHRDAQGHEHYWTFDGERGRYRPDAKAELPTLEWVRTGTYFYPDGESYDVGEYRCRQCGEVVTPRRRADDTRQFVPGIRHYLLDGVSVPEAEFMAAAKEAGLL